MRLVVAIFIVVSVFLFGVLLAGYFELPSVTAIVLSSILSYVVLAKMTGPVKFRVQWGIFDRRKPNIAHLLEGLDAPEDRLAAEKVAGFLSAFYGVDVAHVHLDDDLWIRGFRPQGMLPQVASVHARILGRRLGVKLRVKKYVSMRTMRQFIEFSRF
ncbi:hypothetical protein [Ralstonia pseudosolanacearum]